MLIKLQSFEMMLYRLETAIKAPFRRLDMYYDKQTIKPHHNNFFYYGKSYGKILSLISFLIALDVFCNDSNIIENIFNICYPYTTYVWKNLLSFLFKCNTCSRFC